jgi:hypothetical protein
MADAMKIARLPKWAQAYVADLEKRLDRAEDERDDLRENILGPAETDTHADPYGSVPINLPKGCTVQFRIGYGSEDIVRARVTAEGLNVNGSTGIVIIPGASNDVLVAVRRD